MISICKCKYACAYSYVHSLPAGGVMYIWKKMWFRVQVYQQTRGDIEINKEKQPLRVKVCVCVRSVTSVVLLQWCLKLCDPRGYSLPGFLVHGILQARILEWIAMPSSGQVWDKENQYQEATIFL